MKKHIKNSKKNPWRVMPNALYYPDYVRSDHVEELRVLVEQLKADEQFKRDLLEIVTHSSQDEMLAYGAANAITILNAARVSFAAVELKKYGIDHWRGIRIPGADLRYAVMSDLDLKGADLRHVNFMDAWLVGVDLFNARLKGANFGLLPFKENSHIYHMAYSPDNQFIAIACKEMIKVIRRPDRECVHVIKLDTSYYTRIAFSPDSQRLVSGNAKGVVQEWSVSTGKCTKSLKTDEFDISNLSYSPDGNQLALVKFRGELQVWSLKKEKCILLRKSDKYHFFKSLSFSPDGTRLVLGGFCEEVHEYLVKTGERLPNDKKRGGCAWYSLDGKSLYNFPEYGGLVKSSGETDEILYQFNYSDIATTLEVAPNETSLSWGGGRGQVYEFSLASSEIVGTLKRHVSRIKGVSYSPDARSLASYTENDCTLREWSLTPMGILNNPQKYRDKLSCVAYSPDSKYVLLGNADGFVGVFKYSIESGEEKYLSCIKNSLKSNNLTVSPNGLKVASLNSNGKLREFDAETGKLLSKFEEKVSCFAYSPDSKQIAIASANHPFALSVWSLESEECVGTFDIGGYSVSLAYTPDGKHIATLQIDSWVREWSLSPKACVREIKIKHVELFTRLSNFSYSPDGECMVWGNEKTVYVHSITKEKTVCKLEGHPKEVLKVSYSSDGDTLISTDKGGHIFIWSTTLSSVDNKYPLIRWVNAPCMLNLSGVKISSGSGISALNYRLIREPNYKKYSVDLIRLALCLSEIDLLLSIPRKVGKDINSIIFEYAELPSPKVLADLFNKFRKNPYLPLVTFLGVICDAIRKADENHSLREIAQSEKVQNVMKFRLAIPMKNNPLSRLDVVDFLPLLKKSQPDFFKKEKKYVLSRFKNLFYKEQSDSLKKEHNPGWEKFQTFIRLAWFERYSRRSYKSLKNVIEPKFKSRLTLNHQKCYASLALSARFFSGGNKTKGERFLQTAKDYDKKIVETIESEVHDFKENKLDLNFEVSQG